MISIYDVTRADVRRADGKKADMRRAQRGAVLLVAIFTLVVAAACATVPRQVVPLNVEPADASVFVDRVEFAPAPSELSLATDVAHVLFFRAEGYQPLQVVLETFERDGQHVLEPASVRVKLAPLVPTERGVAIEGAD